MSAFSFASSILSIVTIILLQTISVSSFSGGAPYAACSSLSPFHLFASASPSNDCPFVMKAFPVMALNENGTKVLAVDVLIMTRGGIEQPIRGFMVQARSQNITDIILDGNFVPTNETAAQSFTCGFGNQNGVSAVIYLIIVQFPQIIQLCFAKSTVTVKCRIISILNI